MPLPPVSRFFPALRHGFRPACCSLLLLFTLACAKSNGVPHYPEGYREYAYVANQGGNSISVLDLVQLRPERTLGVGESPVAVAASPTLDEVYAISAEPGKSAGSLAVIDVRKNSVAARLALGRTPAALALSPNGRRAYVANEGSGTVSVVDLQARRVVQTLVAGHHPGGLAVAPDGRTLAVTDPESGILLLFSIPTDAAASLRASFSGCPGATSPRILRDSSKVFAGCGTGHQVLAVGLAAIPGSWDATQEPALLRDRLLALLDVGPQPRFLTLKPDGGEIFSSNEAGGTVSEIATTTNEVGSTYPIGNTPLQGVVSADGSALWVAASGTDAVSLYSISDGKFLSSVRTGSNPSALSFASGDALLLAADTRSGDIAIIRTASKLGPALLTILPAGSRPVALAVKALAGKS